MRTLLINASFPEYKGKDLFPIGIGILGAIAKKYGETKIIDLNVSKLTNDEIKKIVLDFKPEIAGISSTSPSFEYALEIVKIAKANSNAKIIMGGSHVSFLPQQALDAGIDFIVKGEGDKTAEEIFQGKTPDKGIIYKKNNGIIELPDQELIDDLDSLPIPAYELFNLKKYEIMSVITSRGCPFSCAYCCASKFWKNKIRYRSPENIIKELKYLSKFFNKIKFHDSTFTVDKERVKKICELMKNEDLNFKWSCESRADTLDEELLKKMKDAGCILICIGVDSICETVLNSSNRFGKPEILEKIFLLSKDIGINMRAYVTFGLPNETKESVQATIDFLKRVRPFQIMLSLATAYPGTELSKGKTIIMPRDWCAKFDGHGRNYKLYLPETLNKKEYKELADYMWEEIRKLKRK